MEKGTGTILAIFTGLIGLAMVAVLVSQKANTSSVISAIASGGGTLLGAATAPVTGGGGTSLLGTGTG